MMTKFPEPDTGNGSPKLEIFNPSGYPLPFNESELLACLQQIESGESVRFRNVEVVFTDEDGIVDINSEYLGRDYVTDIISFRLDDDNDDDNNENDSNQSIEGTLYCCAPRIAEQSSEFEADTKTEFLRVFVHGLLHLTGYDDQTESDKAKMTSLENHYLQSLTF